MKQLTNIKHIMLLMVMTISFVQCKDQVGEALKDLEVNTNEVVLRAGDTQYIDIKSGNSEYKAISTDNRIVVAEIAENNKIKVKALNTGATSIIVFDMKAEKNQKIKVKVMERIPLVETEKTNIKLVEGDEEPIKIIAGSGKYEVKVEDPSIATAKLQPNGKFIELLISALKPGDTAIDITDTESGLKKSLSIKVNERIPDLMVDQMEISIMVHQKLKINVTQGSGEYEVAPKNKKLVNATINNTEITISGIAEGETTVAVSDKRSLQLININVKITPFKHDKNIIVNGIKYGVSEDLTVEVVAGDTPYTGEVIIPETIEKDGVTYTVTTVGEKAFSKSKVTAVTLPNSIKEIKAFAFLQCTHMTECNIPSSVTHLGLRCFENCNMLRTLHLPASIAVIDGSTLGGFKSLDNYRDDPYDNEPKNTSFIKFNELENLTIDPVNPNFKVENNILYTKDGKVVIGAALRANLGAVEIPEGVEFISDYTFAFCNTITSVYIPSSTLAVCSGAFTECHNLEKIQFGKEVGEYETELYDQAFRNCYGLKEIKCYSTYPLYPYTGCFKMYDPTSDPDGSKEQAILNNLKVYIPRGSRLNYSSSSWGWHIFPNKIDEL